MPIYGNKSYKLKIVHTVESVLLEHLKRIDKGNPKVKVYDKQSKEFLDGKSNYFTVSLICTQSSLTTLGLGINFSALVLNTIGVINPAIGLATVAGGAALYGIGIDKEKKLSEFNKDEIIKNQLKILEDINSQISNYYVEFGELNIPKGISSGSYSELKVIVHPKK